MRFTMRYLTGSIAIALILCLAQIRGSTVLILASLAGYLALLGYACTQNFTLPMLLFFLPWSPLMRTNPTSFSFYTFGLVLVCGISMVKNRYRFKRYHLVVGILLTFLTLLSKLLDGSWISFDYIAFLMLIFLFPVVKEEHNAKIYDFYLLVVYFSVGIIAAALCARRFMSYSNIAKYITVHSYLTITRMCGFYGDPNFYAAQVTAALGGGFYAILQETVKKRTVTLATLLFLLMYCGFLSGSKSFALVAVVLVGLWVIEMLRMRGKTGRKIVLILFGIAAAVYIASSAIFGELIDVIATRFSFTTNLSTLTTGRTELWMRYIKEILGNGKILFFGKGFTNIKVGDRASHNTILQMIYQLGIIGAPILAMWIGCFFKGVSLRSRNQGKRSISAWILLAGAFMPWLAIDAMFFDEFFLLQWFVFVALQGSDVSTVSQPGNQIPAGRPGGGPRMRIVWK